MYVKVTRGHAPRNPKGDFLCKVTPPIYYDYMAFKLGTNAKWAPSEGGADGTKLVDPDIDWQAEIGADINYMHVLELDADTQTNYEKEQRTLAVRYVWWMDPVTGCTAVVTTRNIFILGENGKTIDKVS